MQSLRLRYEYIVPCVSRGGGGNICAICSSGRAQGDELTSGPQALELEKLIVSMDDEMKAKKAMLQSMVQEAQAKASKEGRSIDRLIDRSLHNTT